MLANLHTHTCFSDGSSPPEDYLHEAIRQGFSTLGFTDHSPVPFKNSFAIKEGKVSDYCKTILELKAISSSICQSQNQELPKNVPPEILLGLEIDFIPGVTSPFTEYRKSFPLDYVIGSIHLVRAEDPSSLWFIDGPDIAIYDYGIQEVFQGDIRRAVSAYYRQVQEMVTDHHPDIVGHLDKVKMYNRGRYFSEEEKWYVNLIDETLELIRQAGCVVEVNTRGLYKKRSDTLFPGPAVLKKIHAKKIPVTICSDAHKPQELSLQFDEARRQLKETGFTKTMTRSQKKWIELPI